MTIPEDRVLIDIDRLIHATTAEDGSVHVTRSILVRDEDPEMNHVNAEVMRRGLELVSTRVEDNPAYVFGVTKINQWVPTTREAPARGALKLIAHKPNIFHAYLAEGDTRELLLVSRADFDPGSSRALSEILDSGSWYALAPETMEECRIVWYAEVQS